MPSIKYRCEVGRRDSMTTNKPDQRTGNAKFINLIIYLHINVISVIYTSNQRCLQNIYSICHNPRLYGWHWTDVGGVNTHLWHTPSVPFCPSLGKCVCEESTLSIRQILRDRLVSHSWKYCWLICCERKILFVDWKNTAYKSNEQGVEYQGDWSLLCLSQNTEHRMHTWLFYTLSYYILLAVEKDAERKRHGC